MEKKTRPCLLENQAVPLPHVAEVINRSTLGAPLADAAAVMFRAGAGVVQSSGSHEA